MTSKVDYGILKLLKRREKNEKVYMGQIIGYPSGGLSCPVHSSVSGIVKAVEPHWYPSGVKVRSVVIENDFQDTLHPDIQPRTPEQVEALKYIGKKVRE